MKKTSVAFSALAIVALVSACSTPDRPVTSRAEFDPDTKTPYIGHMAGSEGPVGNPSAINEDEQVSTSTDERNSADLAGNEIPDADRMEDREMDMSGASAEGEMAKDMDHDQSVTTHRTSETSTTGASTEANEESDTASATSIPMSKSEMKSKRNKSAKKYREAMPAMSEQQMLWQKELALNQMHHINQKEIAMAEMAKEKSENAQVKAMADKILADHQKLKDQVKSVADAETVSLHSFQPATHEAAFMDRLRSMEGAEFDRAFMTSMKMSHESALRDLRFSQSMVKDPEVAALIRGAIPSIRSHGQMSTTGASRIK